MANRPRIRYTSQQKSEMWDRWQRGESLKEIGRVFDRPSSSIFGQLSPTGGIRPPPRRRSRLALTLLEREEISRGLVSQHSLRAIATRLGRAPSTISREIRRNLGAEEYRAAQADQAAWTRTQRPKRCKLGCYPALSEKVADRLQQQWSPQQIAGWLKREYPGEARNQVSHETIYRSLFIQARGVLKKELQLCLRSQRAIHRSVHATMKQRNLGQLPHMVSIRSDLLISMTGPYLFIGKVTCWQVPKTVILPPW